MAQDAGTDAASIFGEPKVDCHCHVLDPAIHPYGADTPYRPEGQEIGTPAQMRQVFETYGVQRALLVQPNSGYGYDNSCLLAAIAASGGRWRGVATAPRDASVEDLGRLKAAGIVGVAINATFHGVDHYRDWAPLADRLAELDLFLQVQAEGEQWLALMPLVRGTRARLLIDHCGRPDAAAGLGAPAFRALLDLGREGRAIAKLSGYAKFAREPHPCPDAWPFVRALVEAFGPRNCVWGSDWPFLRAPTRVDYGPLLTLFARLFPDPALRRTMMWDNPIRLFGFAAAD